MRYLAVLLMLCACASPSPGMMGAVRHDVRVGGLDFAVFHKDDRAEVVRMTSVARPSRATIPQLMAQAAGQATGCTVIDFSRKTLAPGDTGVASFDLDCWVALSPRPENRSGSVPPFRGHRHAASALHP